MISNKQIIFLIIIFLTVLYMLFAKIVYNNPSVFSIVVLTLTTVLMTMLFFVELEK
jgi:hypothetical protein